MSVRARARVCPGVCVCVSVSVGVHECAVCMEVYGRASCQCRVCWRTKCSQKKAILIHCRLAFSFSFLRRIVSKITGEGKRWSLTVFFPLLSLSFSFPADEVSDFPFGFLFCYIKTNKQTTTTKNNQPTNQPTNDSRACLKSSALATDIMLTLKMRSELYHVTKTNPHEHKRKQIPSHTYTHTQTHTRTHTHTHTKQNKQNTNISSLTVTAFCPNSSSYLLVLIEF